MLLTKTSRGFALGHFLDAKGVKCSIQDSSLATRAAIWFGVQDANPQKLGPNGLEPVPSPVQPTPVPGFPDMTNHMLFNTRMHLGVKQARSLQARFKQFLANKAVKPVSFQDLYGHKCSLCVEGDYLKVGCDDADPKICDGGWRPVQYPEDTIFTTYMFLQKEQVTYLLPVLQSFITNGCIADYE